LMWIGGVALVALIAGWTYKRYTDPIRAREALDAAQRLYSVARYDQVVVSCDRAISLKPDLTEAYLLRGRARVAVYDSAGAIADFGKAAQLRPGDPQPLIERAAALVDQKHYAAAVADTTAALALNPNLARAYNIRGTSLRAMGDTEGAIGEFARAVEIEPNSDNYYQRGATYQLLADHRRAVADFTQAIAWDPDKPQTYFARAESERALGETKEADADHLQGRILDGR
jgi:tetratricopeptide (TPR) repeat protein